MSNVEGKVGYVTVATRGPDGPGEIKVAGAGAYIAWSREAIPVGAEVLVTGNRDTRTVSVQPTGL